MGQLSTTKIVVGILILAGIGYFLATSGGEKRAGQNVNRAQVLDGTEVVDDSTVDAQAASEGQGTTVPATGTTAGTGTAVQSGEEFFYEEFDK